MTGGASLYARIFTSSAIYGVAVFAPTVASFIMLPVYTHYLSPADYAVIELLTVTQNLFSMLVGGRFAEALYFFYAKAKTEEDRNATVGTAMAGALLVAVVGTVLGWAASGWLSRLVFQAGQWTFGFRLSFVTFGLSLPLEIGLAWLRARDVPVRYVTASLLRIVSNVAFVFIFLVLLRRGITGALWGNLISTGFISLLIGASCIRAVSWHFVPSIFRGQMKFAMLLGLGGIALFIIHSGDRFFLQRSVSLNDVGIYSLAYKFGTLVSIPQTAFGQYWAGQSYVVISGDRALARFARINTYLMTVLACGAVYISVFAAPVVRTFTRVDFWPCIPYVPWVAAAYLVRAQGDYLRQALYIHAKPGLDTFVTWSSAVFCLGAYATLIPFFGLGGAILATGLTFVFMTGVAWTVIRRYAPYSLEYRRLLKLVAAGVLVSLAGTAKLPASLTATWSLALLCAAVFAALLWTTFLDGWERSVIADSCSRVLVRWRGTRQ